MNNLQKLLIPLLAAATLLLSSCASQSATLGVGALAGGVVGNALHITDSLTSGGGADAAAGIVLGTIAANEVQKNSRTEKERLEDAYLQGQRAARVETGNEFWKEATYADGSHPNLQKAKKGVRQIQSDTRYIEGVKYGSYYTDGK